MPHEYHGDDVKTSYSKIEKILGHSEHKRFQHPSEKANDLANIQYYENEHLDPLTMDTQEKVGP